MTRRTRSRSVSDHLAAAAAARAVPGTWVWAGDYPSSLSAKGAAADIRAARYPAYSGGGFEAYAAPTNEAEAVWVRYTRGVQNLTPRPDRMTVRVNDRGDGSRGYVGVTVVEVTIATTCAQCGGPRGWDTVRPHRFSEDGAYYTCDTWTNPCWHVDMYEAVLEEARRRPLPPVPAELAAGA